MYLQIVTEFHIALKAWQGAPARGLRTLAAMLRCSGSCTVLVRRTRFHLRFVVFDYEINLSTFPVAEARFTQLIAGNSKC
ncbi:hypothetical protein EJB06_04810 [Massilia atriviolacea]|uniref:Uncharacterized protein n=1 Tax=Massilia atriviolacea TaxID=2495579 RepID=A0A430HSI8_9BURK|nr:hypothetical protein EJB06_04810 [Massilia atriviolacea]